MKTASYIRHDIDSKVHNRIQITANDFIEDYEIANQDYYVSNEDKETSLSNIDHKATLQKGIGNIIMQNNQTFVTSNRSLEYNIDHTYLDACKIPAKNRIVLNRFNVNKELYSKLDAYLFPSYLKSLKECNVYCIPSNEDSDNSGDYYQHMGQLNTDQYICVDITIDSSDNLQVFVLFQERNREFYEIVDKIRDFIVANAPVKEVEPSKLTFNMIAQNNSSLYLIDVEAKPFGDSDTFLQDNYNDDFIDFNESILDSFESDSSGLILLHGTPGTGKTNYIRYLISENSDNNRNIIYIPPDMAELIAQPSFIPFMLNNRNSILIIEDAENILKKRINSNNQAVANLLNITDGLLGDCLNFIIVCTFNCDENEIDSALLREGRLIGKYKFEPLLEDKAKHLLNKLDVAEGCELLDYPMTLASIYNRAKNKSKHTKKS